MKLTVIVTVFNIAEYLPRFFEAMMNQTFTDFTLLVLDDGSEDNSLEVCRQFASKDNRIKVVEHEHVGIAGIKNAAMEYIDTEYTAYADGDDYVEPDYLMHLMTAIEKYNADLAISRVQYHLENGHIEGSFRSRGELIIQKDEFSEKLPMLLDDRRLNYVYGKVYRSSLLKDIRVEDDVKQGMDTMINFMYLPRTGSIVLIDDLDYHYIRYNKRSITSYQGEDAYQRILRINLFIENSAKEMGILFDEMRKVIDSRILQSASWVIDKIISSDSDKETKAAQITEILNNEHYVQAYQRQKDILRNFGFDAIAPQSGESYLSQRERQRKRNTAKESILAHTPKPIVALYHKLKGAPDN